MATPLALVTVAAGALAWMMRGHTDFAPGVCQRLEPFLSQHIVGQEAALRQFSDAACDLIRRDAGSAPGGVKPLIISVHGPPGVGKSLTHLLAAKALYNRDPLAADQCPGHHCAGYKVMFGMDYVASELAAQHAAIRASVLDHLRRSRRAVVVVEEYDKLDCATRAMFRQLFDNLHAANVTTAAPIILLESNTGYLQIYQLLEEAGDRNKVDAEEAQRVLKDLIFQRWASDGCEERSETIKMVSMIDFFLPYLPLEPVHLRELMRRRLVEEDRALRRLYATSLRWGDPELDFLLSKVDFEGGFAIEGAKEVSTVATRHITRLLRPWLAAQDSRILVMKQQQGWTGLLRDAQDAGQHAFATARVHTRPLWQRFTSSQGSVDGQTAGSRSDGDSRIARISGEARPSSEVSGGGSAAAGGGGTSSERSGDTEHADAGLVHILQLRLDVAQGRLTLLQSDAAVSDRAR